MIRVTLFCGWLALGLTACSKAPTPTPPPPVPTNAAPQAYEVKGVIKEVQLQKKRVVIQHEAVTNYMPAMTMPFDVRDAKELAGLKAGQRVAFRMLVTPTDGWIEQIKVLAETNTPPPPPPPEPSFRRVRLVEPLKIGDALPGYPFTNELGQAVTLADFKGQALAFTFIFTRCPFPTFCPRMSENFSAAYQKLSELPDASGNWHLLSISFDPEHDTPAVLKAYAGHYPHDPRRWNFVTGALVEVDAITEQFGLVFSRDPATASINHNLRTVIVDTQGRVQKVFVGNEWKVEDFVAEMIKAAAAK